ncbi:uncharacterized protein HD556DRAFT_1436934 [Suillus plorans]|uniref:Uncharacterized protein n=1 Tax=Suillus plorans TaxID=116603 RepID=A0A9P7DWI9_9AGAM|nr:uncharacterized protein HD556DRAFT_1436934 [Suillus plorans]KAG1804752.1 hypothetical protein HD556DRAFT_1436934 [Suillus plorans]
MQTFRYQSAIKAAVEASFAWAPLLSAEPRDADDLASPESILPDAKFAALEESKKTEEVLNVDEVLEENAFDFKKLDWVKEGMIRQTILDEIEVINSTTAPRMTDVTPGVLPITDRGSIQ